MTKESLRILENTPVGKTVEVEGRVITVADRTICCADNKCTFGGWRNCRGPRCTATSRFDNKFVAYIDVTPPAVAPHNELLNSKSAAHRLGVTVKKIREMARTGKIPAHKNGAWLGNNRGRDWVFDSRDVEIYANNAKRPAIELDISGLQYRPMMDAVIAKFTPERRVKNFESVPDAATRLLPFDGVDEHRVFPIARYLIEELGDGIYSAVGYVGLGGSVIFRGSYGNRAQAVEACRNDLRLRLAAVDELREDCK